MTIWLPDLSERRGPRSRALADAISDAVAEGTLAPGTRLPPQRELAHALGLSLGTVTRAYQEAERRGLLAGEVGRGTYVRAGDGARDSHPLWGPSRREDGPIGMVMNLPPPGLAGAALAETFAELSRTADLGALLDHQFEGRIETHLQSAASWLGRLGLSVAADEVVLTNGAQHGVLMALMALTRPGDTILGEALTYPPLKEMARHLGLRTNALAMDEDGLLPDALDEACRRSGAKVLYCMPTLHSPTGATMPEARRRDVAAIARRHDVTVIEDDVFGFLPEARPAPLAAHAPERTLLVTSVSKSMAPGLRVGMVRVPETHREALRHVVQMSCWMPSPVTCEIAHRWIVGGWAARLNDGLRGEMAARCALAREILGDRLSGQDGLRFHLWLDLPAPWSEAAFRAAAEARGVQLAAGETFLLKAGAAPGAVRLALGYESGRERLARGLGAIAEILTGGEVRQAVIV